MSKNRVVFEHMQEDICDILAGCLARDFTIKNFYQEFSGEKITG